MAYKFQLGAAQLSGSLVQEGAIAVHNESGAEVANLSQAGILSGSGAVKGASLSVDNNLINSDGSGQLAASGFGDGSATLTGGNLTGAGNVSGSGEIGGATAKFGGLNFEGSHVLTSNTGVILFGATADQELQAGVISGSGAIKGPNLVLGGGTWTEAGVLSPDGAISAGGSVTAVGSFIIGSADMNEADLEKLDGITNGTAAASKAVVLDASKNIGTIGQLTASILSGTTVNVPYSGLEINGTAVSSTAAELNILDGVTATAAELNYNDIAALGTGVASKALVFDASGQFDGVTNGLILSASVFSGSGAGLTNIDVTNLDAAGSNTQIQFNDNGEFAGSDALVFNTGAVALIISGSDSGVQSSQMIFGLKNTGHLSIEVDDSAAKISTPHYGIEISGSDAGGITLAGGGSKGVLVDSALGIRGLNAAGDGINWSLLRTGAISGSGALQGPNLVLGGGTWTEAGVLSPDGAVSAGGSVTAVGSFIIGSADLNEADMEKLDGITNGTAAASKAVVLDASKNIATLGTVGCGAITSTGASSLGSISSVGAVTSTAAITAGTSFIIGSADLNEADMEKLDGITNGTAAASKAVVLDASKNIGTIGQLTASILSGTTVNVPYSGLEINGTAVTSTAGELNILDGVTATAAELNYNDIAALGTGAVSKAVVFDADGQFDGASAGLILSSSAISGTVVNVPFSGLEINGVAVSSTAAELNILDGVTATAAELNYNDIASLGTGVASKSLVFDASGQFDGTTNGLILSASYFKGDGSGLTGISSDKVDTTTDSSNATFYLPFVNQATGADGEDLYIHDVLSLNPSSSLFQIRESGVGKAAMVLSSSAGVANAFGGKDMGIISFPGQNASADTVNRIIGGYANFGGGNMDALRIEAAGTNALLYLSGSHATMGVYIDSSFTVEDDTPINLASALTIDDGGDITLENTTTFEDDVEINGGAMEFKGSAYLTSNGTELTVSGSQMCLNITSSNDGDNSLFTQGSAILGHLGSGVGDVKLFAGDSGQAGNISGSRDLEMGRDIYAKESVYAGDLVAQNQFLLAGASGVLTSSANVIWGGSTTGLQVDTFLTASSGVLFENVLKVNGATTLAAVTATTMSGSSTLHVGGGVTMAGLGTSTVDLTADLMIIDDGAGGSIKTTSLANYATAIAGAGLDSTAGALVIDLYDIAGAAVDVANDSIAIVDATDDSTKKEQIVDLVSAMAGAGITATAGVLSVSAVSTPTAFGDEAATMVEGLNYASAALTAARVLTLPDSDDLDVGEFVKIKMAAGVSSTNYASVVIDVGSGDLIDGDASIKLESPYAAVDLYKVAANTWRIL